jgi:hypothetical protein
MPAQTVIKLRRGTAAEWTTANPVLAAGEMGIETDTARSKFGDGSTAWTSLNYTVGDSSGVGSIDWTSVTSKPTEFPPEPHAASHELGGADEIEIDPTQVTGTAIVEGDARLTDARTPTAHASSHELGGSDELELDPTQVTGTAIVEGDARLTDARTPTAHTHVKADITDFAHTHVVADITDFDPATKQDTITGAASTITSSNLTASRAVVSDGSGKVASSATTAAELGHVSGVTSAIQTQLNAKVNTVNGAVTTAATGSTVVRNITLSTADPSGGSDGQVWLKYT